MQKPGEVTRFEGIPLTVKDFAIKTTEMKPSNLKLDAEILRQKISLTSEFIKNIESEKK